jgi:hypothetical protein
MKVWGSLVLFLFSSQIQAATAKPPPNSLPRSSGASSSPPAGITPPPFSQYTPGHTGEIPPVRVSSPATSPILRSPPLPLQPTKQINRLKENFNIEVKNYNELENFLIGKLNFNNFKTQCKCEYLKKRKENNEENKIYIQS